MNLDRAMDGAIPLLMEGLNAPPATSSTSLKHDEQMRSPQPMHPSGGPKTLPDALNPRIEALARDGGSRPRSRPGTPRSKPRTRPGTPKDGAASGAGEMTARPLNVTDALSYLDAVKNKFSDKPDVYNHFLDIMKEFKGQQIDTPGVIERVSMLFQGNPDLIQGFNTFLPPGYHIECTTDASQQNFITVTTPQGIMTQGGNTLSRLRFPRDAMGQPTTIPTPLAGIPPPFSLGSGLPHAIAPLGTGAASRPVTPHAFPVPHMHNPFMPGPAPYSPGVHGSTNAAASFLHNLNNPNRHAVEKPHGEFNHAIQYLNKIKTRFSEDPNTYKQFLEILQAYQKDQRNLEDSQVYAQVQILFKDAPELLEEFKAFLPEALGIAPPSGGLIGIMPHPPGGSVVGGSAWGPGEPSGSTGLVEKPRAPNRRKKRPAEQDVTPVPPTKASSSRSKKSKNQHKADPPSPVDSPHQLPASPDAYANMQQSHHAHQPAHQPTAYHPQQSANHIAHMHIPHHGYPRSSPDDVLFFEHTRKALASRDAYDDFLKLLDLFTRDVIDSRTLIRRAERFLGDGELMASFKDLMGWDDRAGNIAYGPPGSIRTGPPEALTAAPVDDGQGPSYRKLPESEVRLACSGRDELARSVLNDGWVSHPTWASEEAGFVAHKKNSFEEALHKSEEERHEYTVLIQGLTRTIAVLEPLNDRIEDMTAEERAEFKLRQDLGGPAPCIYQRTIKKVYGREAGIEIHKALQDCPSVAVPVVLTRLKQKDEEWRRAQREWSRTWREVDHKNFYKSLDHQGITFKMNDKKGITAKHFVADIEAAKVEQERRRERQSGPSSRVPAFARGSMGPQLEYAFPDVEVLQDALHLVHAYLDHNAAYHSTERRILEGFLRDFVPTLLMLSPQEFNSGCGSLSSEASGPASRGDARDVSMAPGEVGTGTLVNGKTIVAMGERSAQKEIPNDTWVREAVNSVPGGTSLATDSPVKRKPFFANTTFYTLLRLLQLLYSRLSACKEVGARLATEKYASLTANPVAVELGLDEPGGASAMLLQVIETYGKKDTNGTTNVLYAYLLDACVKLFDGDMEQATFEEHMRWFFGTKAFYTFTLDKVVIALIKQAQTIVGDGKCEKLWELLQEKRASEFLTGQDTIRYRREAELHVGSDEHLYRIEWQPTSSTLHIQLLSMDDPSVDEARQPLERWREYVDTYVTRHPTEWTSTGAGPRPGCPPFLRRCLPLDDAPVTDQMVMADGLAVRISLGTYKLFYEAGTQDALHRRRIDPELEGLAKARGEERRRKWRTYLSQAVGPH